MEKSSTTKVNEILPEFQRFLLEKKLAPEKNVFFYALWTSKFFNFARKKQISSELYQENAVSEFLEALESDPHISDWQIRQAGDAIRLFIFITGDSNPIIFKPQKRLNQQPRYSKRPRGC